MGTTRYRVTASDPTGNAGVTTQIIEGPRAEETKAYLEEYYDAWGWWYEFVKLPPAPVPA